MAKEYRVTWEIDITADSPREAAEQARACQGSNTVALSFDVTDDDDVSVMIDLSDIDEG